MDFVVTPFVGVWIETQMRQRMLMATIVTPFVGVWIETGQAESGESGGSGHTLRGCVD